MKPNVPVNRNHTSTWIAATILAIPLLLMALTARAGLPAAPDVPMAGADLIVLDVSLSATNINLNDNLTISAVIKNQGDTTTSGGSVFVHVFTPKYSAPAFPNGRQLGSIFSVDAGQVPNAFSLSRTDWFLAEGCGQQIRVVVDKDNIISESNESNNEKIVLVDVGPGCTPTPPPACTVDAFENDFVTPPNVAFAEWIGEDSPQPHTFCNQDTQTTTDIDLIKFTAFSGLSYTVSTSDLGADASPKITILKDINTEVKPGSNGSATFKADYNGIFYAKIENTSASNGVLTAYNVTLNTTNGVTDEYEPDNKCSTARDILTTGAKQNHLFQSQGDEDWVKFSAKAGDSFSVVAGDSGPNVSPKVDIFASCDQVQSNNALNSGIGQAAASSNTDQTFFARLLNGGTGFGAAAKYSVAVTASNCIPDGFEDDDNKDQARPLTTDGTKQNHNACPAQDHDWVKFDGKAGKTYVILTSNLAFASDTVLTLFGTDGTTQIAENDDYDYVSGSRIVFQPSADGTYFARVRHANPVANGPNTQYDLSIHEGVCTPDPQEGANGNNGSADASVVPTNGVSQTHNFCANPLSLSLGDQDWMKFNGVVGGNYQIFTTGLGPNSDTVLELYGPDGSSQLGKNDDAGSGRGATLHFTPTNPGTYYLRVTQYNSNVNGNEANYNVQVFATEPPTPTPTPTFTPSPTPPPVPTATPAPSNAKTLIIVNRARFESLYGTGNATTLMNKLFQLADDTQVTGVVIQVETDPNVAAAYTAWLAAPTDNAKANDVVTAIRNRVLNFIENAPQVKQVVIIGDDRVIPFRRVLDKVLPQGTPAALSIEENYADDLSNAAENETVRVALAANMILTDDYLVDKEPSSWKDKQNNSYELFVPDYATGRLVESPSEIIAFIDNFLGGDKSINISPGAGKVLVTGYDFVQDGAEIIKTLFSNDQVKINKDEAEADIQLIGPQWPGDILRTKYFAANPRFEMYSINGHSTHIAQGVPQGEHISAGFTTTATTDMSGALVYSVGCHGGLNDPAVLDLPQVYMQKLANYVGNTGFGWGGGGIVYSEALARNFTRELLRETQSSIGPALANAKKKYFTQAATFNAYDAKILMQMTLYGLPMVGVTSSGNLNADENIFPSVPITSQLFSPPTAFGDGPPSGTVGYKLPGSFGAFGDDTSSQGQSFNLDGNVTFAAGEPLQPQYFANISAPAAGELRGAIFLGGVYSDTPSFDPVIALADNEYVTSKTEPTFTSEGFYPAVPFSLRSIENGGDTIVMTLGQYQSNTDVTGAAVANSGINRVFDQMSFGAYYSNSPDRNAANIAFIDGVVIPGTGTGTVKVEANDSSGINAVVVAFNEGQGQWKSSKLKFDAATVKWTGIISGTVNTQFFVQVVDNAGNVAINDNKGRYYKLVEPLPLVQGKAIDNKVYLPVVSR